MSDSATLWIATCQAPLSFAISWSLLRFMSIGLVMWSNHLILCWPLLLLPSVFPSISIFSSELALHIKWAKCWSFSFCISPSKEYTGLISFRMDWLDLLAVQGTLKSLLQHHSSKLRAILRLQWCPASGPTEDQCQFPVKQRVRVVWGPKSDPVKQNARQRWGKELGCQKTRVRLRTRFRM